MRFVQSSIDVTRGLPVLLRWPSTGMCGDLALAQVLDELAHVMALVGAQCVRRRVNRRQADSWQDLENGSARHPQTADHRRHGRGAMDRPPRRAEAIVAGRHDRSQASPGDRHRAA